MSPSAPPRVFMGMTEVAGYLAGLKRGFDALGIPSLVVDGARHPFQYSEVEPRHGLIRLLQWITRRRIRSSGIAAGLWLCFQMLFQIMVLIWALPRFDCFIFAAGHSFLEGHDLPVLKRCGKCVVSILMGTDSRPPYLTRMPQVSGAGMIRRARWLKRRLRRIERSSDYVINSPLQSHFQENRFIMFQAMGIPRSVNAALLPSPRSERVRILHAPSFPEGKGTSVIRRAIQNLIQAGIPIDYLELTGQPNSEVLRQLRSADFVVDELFSDALMATFAAEAAACGKPAIVAGYGQNLLRSILPPVMIPPIYHCRPDQVESAIQTLAIDVGRREDLGRRAFEFVRKFWSPPEVARRYLQLFQREAPEEWFFDPGTLRYIAGWGLTPDLALQQIRNVLEIGGGIHALGLADKPDLQRRLVDFAEGRITDFEGSRGKA